MGKLLQTLFNQPSRTYAKDSDACSIASVASVASAASAPEPSTEPSPEELRAARRAQYYNAAADIKKSLEFERRRTIRKPVIHHETFTSTALRLQQHPPSSLSHRTASSSTVASITSTPRDDDEETDFYTPKTSPHASPKLSPVSSAERVPSPRSSAESTRSVATPDAKSKQSPPLPPPSSVSAVSEDEYTNYSWPMSRSDDTSTTENEYLSADWAKDVRWLVPADSSYPYPVRSHSLSLSSGSSSSSSRSSGSNSHRKSRSNPPPRPKRRMSEIREEEEGSDEMYIQVSSLAHPADHAHPRRTHSARRKKAASIAASSASSLSSKTVELPPLVPHSQPHTYSSMVLPRGAYQPSKHPDRLPSTVDITLSGIASTTMSTISITKHAAEVLGARHRRMSVASVSSIFTSNSRSSLVLPEHLRYDIPTPLAFSSHVPPPNKVQAQQLIVQVHAVAVDGLDVVVVREKSKTPDGYGFVPGRGVVGRVIECGYEVTNVRRGDWVFGTLEFTKAGGLSEFVVMDKKRVYKAPTPSYYLRIEHIACLSTTALVAHRAVHTWIGNHKSIRALVLQAHCGVGYLATQELLHLGANVIAQIPSDDEEAVERVTYLGVREVKLGTPEQVVASLEEDSIDFVIDTIGGREIWHQCHRLFGATGQFTTVIGDSLEAALSRNAHVKSNMRSLRKAFTKSSQKHIGYEWVSPSTEIDHQGKGIRDTMENIVKLVMTGVLRPVVDDVVMFERAPTLLNEGCEEGRALMAGRVAVVRVLE